MMNAATLFLRRRSPPLYFMPELDRPAYSTYLASVYRLFSAAAVRAPSSSPHFAAVDYLIQSCGLPSDVAIRTSKKIQHLKSPDNPDAVLGFLRQAGISESNIQTAVSREPRILCSSVENSWRPAVAKLQEIGLSIEDISSIISDNPSMFRLNIVPKLDFWKQYLCSVKNPYAFLRNSPAMFRSNLEKVVMPNLSFLQEECGLSVRQILQLTISSPRWISSNPETLKMTAKRADQLGVRRSSPMFVYALITVGSLNRCTVDARLNNLRRLGFSQEEVNSIVSKLPVVLRIPEELIGRKLEFLVKEAGSDKPYLLSNVSLFTYSLEKRLIPRNQVRKLLKLKGLPVANFKFATFINPTEQRFLKKFILPYEPAIPGLHQAYTDACAGDVRGLNGLTVCVSS
jgi:mTERF domain-containing protein, mitochondrial